jgi:hypothetical protein
MFLTLGLAVGGVGAWVLPVGGESAPAAPVGRALLIGINKYQNLPHLRGSINDIETMRQVLITRFGFSEKRIKMLTDEAATRDGILAALERLAKQAGPNEVVYIHYSGHGSQVPDLNGDEEDGLDETIVPQDGRTPNVPDIIDDQLEEIISRLKARAALIVLDSCHSGTATRGLEVRTRSVPQDTRLNLYQEWSVKTRSVVPLINARYVLMTGAAANQPALDAPVDGRVHGVFTFALSRSLGSVRPDASPREVFAGVERELKRIQPQLGRTAMPEPQLEGPAEKLDQPLLPMLQEAAQPAPTSGQGARLSWVEVQPMGPDRALLVNGLSLGALPGSYWAVYPPGESAFPPGRAMAVAVVTETRGRDAVARIEPSGRSILPGARAVAQAPPPVSSRVPVYLRDVPPGIRERLTETLRQRLGEIDLVGPGAFARFVIDLKGEQLHLYGADGLTEVGIFPVNDARWVENFSSVLTRSANATDLMTLDNPSSRLGLEARVVTRGPTGKTRGIGVVADMEPSRYRIRRPADPRTHENSLQLEIRVNADAYLTIVDVDSQGGVNLLFPNEHQKQGFSPEGKVRRGERVLLPDSLQTGNRSGFHWDYTPPSGTDTIRVFASTDLDTANQIRQYAKGFRPVMQTGTRGTGSTRGTMSRSLEGLRDALGRAAIRGLITVADEPLQPMGGFPPDPGRPMPGGTSPSSVVPASPGPAQTAPDWTATSVTVLVAE